MNAEQQARLYSNTAESMVGVPAEIVERALGHYAQISQQYADGIQSALNGFNAAAKAAE
jgi:catalase